MGRMKRAVEYGVTLLVALDVCLTYVFLYLPIVVLIVYSVSASRYALVWGGFSVEPYEKLLRTLRPSGRWATVSSWGLCRRASARCWGR
jgi:ABC-type spermidine/putrescine transport system permease subunit II